MERKPGGPTATMVAMVAIVAVAGTETAAALGFTAFAGYQLDRRYDTSPAFLFAGLALGLIVAGVRLASHVRTLRTLQRRLDHPPES